MGDLLSILRGAFLLLCSVLLVQCSSYQDDLKEVKSFYGNQSYTSALKALDESTISKKESHRLLYLLERSQILEQMGKLDEAQKVLLEADALVDRLYTVSVSKEVGTFLYNDSVQDYSGEDYEKVAIHTMLALSFLKQGDLRSARIEAKKINSRLNEINSKYGEKDKNRYSEDAFARYLSGMIYEALNEYDDAIIDYRKALDLYEGIYGREFKTSTPRSLVQSLNYLYEKRGRRSAQQKLKKDYGRILAADPSNWSDYGQVVVIHQVGQVATKKAEEFVIPVGRQIVRFSFPVIRPKSSYAFGKTGIGVEGRPFSSGEMVQNFDQIAAKTLEDRRGRMILKAGARLVLKGQMTQQAGKQLGPLGELAFNVFGAVSETADTRSWTLLPSQFYVSRTLVRPGETTFRIFNDGKLEKIISEKVKRGEIKFLVQ